MCCTSPCAHRLGPHGLWCVASSNFTMMFVEAKAARPCIMFFVPAAQYMPASASFRKARLEGLHVL